MTELEGESTFTEKSLGEEVLHIPPSVAKREDRVGKAKGGRNKNARTKLDVTSVEPICPCRGFSRVRRRKRRRERKTEEKERGRRKKGAGFTSGIKEIKLRKCNGTYDPLRVTS